jgi:MarR family 2-MHQ and catechol resistance regulon transcriptional repressor
MIAHTDLSGSELSLKLWVVLNRAHSAIARVDGASVAASGLTPGEFAVLEVLLHKGPLLLGEIREKVLVSSGGITYLVDKLEDKGMVHRRPCPEDRRATYAELTAEGRSWIEDFFPAHAERIHTAMSGLDDGEKRAAVDLLKRLGFAASAVEAPVPG